MKYNIDGMMSIITKGNSHLDLFERSTARLILECLNEGDVLYQSAMLHSKPIIDLLIRDEWIEVNNDLIQFSTKLEQFVNGDYNESNNSL